MRPSWVIVRSLVVTPDISMVVCDWSPVRISCGFGWGSSQNGLLFYTIADDLKTYAGTHLTTAVDN